MSLFRRPKDFLVSCLGRPTSKDVCLDVWNWNTESLRIVDRLWKEDLTDEELLVINGIATLIQDYSKNQYESRKE